MSLTLPELLLRGARGSRRAVGGVLCALIVCSCEPREGVSGSEPKSAGGEGSGAPQAVVAQHHDSAPLMHVLEQAEYARQELAREHGVVADSVTVLSARPVTWRSSALGCPQPGFSYTQALVPGVHILLRSGDQIVAYHAAVGRAPFRCPPERAETPAYSEDSEQL